MKLKRIFPKHPLVVKAVARVSVLVFAVLCVRITVQEAAPMAVRVTAKVLAVAVVVVLYVLVKPDIDVK